MTDSKPLAVSLARGAAAAEGGAVRVDAVRDRVEPPQQLGIDPLRAAGPAVRSSDQEAQPERRRAARVPSRLVGQPLSRRNEDDAEVLDVSRGARAREALGWAAPADPDLARSAHERGAQLAGALEASRRDGRRRLAAAAGRDSGRKRRCNGHWKRTRSAP